MYKPVMSKYKLVYLIWLIPAYLLFLTVHQVFVYYGITETYENGNSYTARVIEFDIKQIAAQTNGYVILEFETSQGERVHRKLSLPVELAGIISDFRQIPVRYQKNALEEIVMMPTYDEHRRMVLSNAGMAFIGLVIALAVSWIMQRYSRQKRREGETSYVIERVD